jgi:hypothetical protein
VKIWKFQVPIADEFTISMPAGARLLDVQTQAGEPQIWAICNPAATPVSRSFSLRGTGHDANGAEGAHYVGTFQLQGGALVFHLFDHGEF